MNIKQLTSPLVLLSLGALLCSPLISGDMYAAPRGKKPQHAARQGNVKQNNAKRNQNKAGSQPGGAQRGGRRNPSSAGKQGQGNNQAAVDQQVLGHARKFVDKNNKSGWTCWTDKFIRITKQDARYKALVADLQKVRNTQNAMAVAMALKAHQGFIKTKAAPLAHTNPMELYNILQMRIQNNNSGQCSF